MEVILKQDVKGTGKAGETVKVSDGFARNKLIPSGLAVEATDANKKAMAREKAHLAEKIAADKAAASELAERMNAQPVVIKTKVGEGGKLFGSITSMDIADAIKEQIDVEVEKKKIVLSKPIKEIGETEVSVKLYEGISANLIVKIEEN